jgi:hypothetical protein
MSLELDFLAISAIFFKSVDKPSFKLPLATKTWGQLCDRSSMLLSSC